MIKTKSIGLGAVLALVAALLVPLTLSLTATAAGAVPECDQIESQDIGNECCAAPEGVTQAQGSDCYNPCNPNMMQRGVTQGGGPQCCPDNTPGHWQWGGYGGQNLYFCDAPPNEPPATAPPPSVSPATAAPKKGATAAKPTFTG